MWKRSSGWRWLAWMIHFLCVAVALAAVLAAIQMYSYGSWWEIALSVWQSSFGRNDVIIIIGLWLLLFISSFIYLVISAGRRKHHREIFLTASDRMYSEIYLLLFGALNVIAQALWIGLSTEFGIGKQWGYINGVYTVISYYSESTVVGMIVIEYIFLLFYLQRFVRRRKAEITYWDTSVFHKIGGGIGTAYRNKKTTSRIMWMSGIGIFLYICSLGTGGFSVICLIGLITWTCLIIYKLMKKAEWRARIQEGVEQITNGDVEYQIDTRGMKSDELKMAENINQLGDGLQTAVDEATKNERMKSELITNVSHDIKTPLTSIINYVDLIKREKVDNKKVEEYIKVLDEKSQRLKKLTEDLVEASKANTGNLQLQMEYLDLIQLMQQTLGEFEDKFEERSLHIVCKINSRPMYIYADGRRVWRIFENLLQNVYKYAMPATRVYIDTWEKDGRIAVTVKNISESPLNIPAEELTERFIRGDVARTTEGSGLGLSIAKSLVELMGGQFFLYLDGDLFRVTVMFDLVSPAQQKAEEDITEEFAE